jgi:FkbM family methyltransferase
VRKSLALRKQPLMFEYLRKKLRKHTAKRIFKEYDHKIVEFNLPAYGIIKYAQWLNPLERPKTITESKINFFRKFVKPGDWAIDVGAHTGDTPIPIALAAGPTGNVLALEPNPYIFKILKINCDLNAGKINITPLNFAATATDGEFYYNSSEASFNNGGISQEATNRHGKYSLQTKVKGVNLENYLKKNHPQDLRKLSFVKIDTEGYDVEVLKSLVNIIREYKPAIVFECFGKLTREERENLYEWVAQLGYTLYYFQDFAVNTETKKLAKGDMMNWKHFDIYAVVEK